MTENRPREIQLTSKQLVFVFMSTMLVAVVVFLLGVWVGRGIGVDSLAASAEVVDQSTEKAKAPGATGTNPTPSRDSLTYPGVLQGSGAQPGAAAASQAPPPAAVIDPGPVSSAPSPAPAPPQNPPPPPASTVPPQATAAKPPPDKEKDKEKDKDRESWVIQVGAYSARSGAEKVAAQQRAKGYPVTVTAGPTFKVHLGPYPTRAAADQVAARLKKEGQDLSVIKLR